MEYVMVKRPPLAGAAPRPTEKQSQRRSETRRAIDLWITDGDHQQKGRIADLSIQGAFITGAPAKLDTEFEFEFVLPSGLEPIRAKARVVWCSQKVFGSRREVQNGMGVEFVAISATDHGKLKAFLETWNWP